MPALLCLYTQLIQKNISGCVLTLACDVSRGVKGQVSASDSASQVAKATRLSLSFDATAARNSRYSGGWGEFATRDYFGMHTFAALAGLF
jgi:hypothetical protein